MTAIGNFHTTPEGFEGRLRTLTLDVPLTIVAEQPVDNDKAPTYRVFAGEGDETYEVGAGWTHVGEKAGEFIALVLDDPALPFSLRANLFTGDDGAHILTWTRPSRRKAKD
ncbi:MAG TPA: DUF736 domain-containing protein [Erythrobacter sp.]|nr:DUF736 domain-containing protein [Erythrobacter sp.]